MMRLVGLYWDRDYETGGTKLGSCCYTDGTVLIGILI